MSIIVGGERVKEEKKEAVKAPTPTKETAKKNTKKSKA